MADFLLTLPNLHNKLDISKISTDPPSQRHVHMVLPQSFNLHIELCTVQRPHCSGCTMTYPSGFRKRGESLSTCGKDGSSWQSLWLVQVLPHGQMSVSVCVSGVNYK